MAQQSLKALRERLGFTQAQCAAALGFDKQQAYQNKEAGRRPFTTAEMALLAELFDLPVSVVFPEFRPTAGDMALVRQLRAA